MWLTTERSQATAFGSTRILRRLVMSALGKGYFLIVNDSRQANDVASADEWRRLHARPDALPLPPQPERVGFKARFVGRMPVVRRVVARRT
jgi:hypothetical protein